mgnify:CR=1 FL=1|tara:strand:+ start:116 stop:535 length:420 start_codon:yes stop_codon:yes gene_type:complete
MRNCDGCAVCCYSLTIQDPELDKRSKQFCRYLKDKPPKFTLRSNNKELWKNYNSSCSIHDTKCFSCNTYVCDWVKGFGEEKDKPKLSGLLFDSHRVCEVWDGASKTLEGQATIKRMKNATKKDYTLIIGRNFPMGSIKV